MTTRVERVFVVVKEEQRIMKLCPDKPAGMQRVLILREIVNEED